MLVSQNVWNKQGQDTMFELSLDIGLFYIFTDIKASAARSRITFFADIMTGFFFFLIFVQTFFCDLGIHRLCDVCDDIFAVVFGSCLNFPFIQDFSIYIKKSAFYGCSADIDSKTIFFHFFCSSFFFASDF